MVLADCLPQPATANTPFCSIRPPAIVIPGCDDFKAVNPKLRIDSGRHFRLFGRDNGKAQRHRTVDLERLLFLTEP